MLHAWEEKSGASFRQVLPRTSAMMTPKAKQGHKLNMHAKAFTPLSPSLNQTHPVDKQTQDTRQIYNVTGQKINNPVSLKQIKVNFNKASTTTTKKQWDSVSWLSLTSGKSSHCLS